MRQRKDEWLQGFMGASLEWFGCLLRFFLVT